MPKTPSIGSKAPAFSLKDENGESVELAQVLTQGPVVLIFYPGDLTPGCTIQLCAIRDEWSDFKDRGIQVFGINPGNAESHQAFTNKHHFPFRLLIDENRNVSKSYGAEQDLLIAKIVRRTVVGISKDGKIIYYKTGMPKNADILKAIKSAT